MARQAPIISKHPPRQISYVYLTSIFHFCLCYCARSAAREYEQSRAHLTDVVTAIFAHVQSLRALTRSVVSQSRRSSVMVQSVAAQNKGFQMVVAYEKDRGIGLNGDMPWSLPKDMAYFKSLTTAVKTPGKRNAVLMGRTTWESIPAKFRPLKDRINIVISKTMPDVPANDDVNSEKCPDIVARDFESALQMAYDADKAEHVFVIGGASVYKTAVQHSDCTALHVTQIQSSIKCDTFFPEHPEVFRLWSHGQSIKGGDHSIQFKCYVRGTCTPQLPPGINTRHEEHQYLDLIREVMDSGNMKGDRTGTGTLSLFGKTMRFSLRESFPLLTTKRTFWRGVAEELLWFVSGCTDARVLADKGVHIWDGNGSRKFLDSRGLTDREEMDLGPVYGFQWRHFGAEYGTMHDEYTGKGVDQLAEVIRKIKTDPDDRRIILSAWNPRDLGQMALPPCHMFCQFYVANGELSCSMYQRSCDLGLGVPFNIASYALLTRMIAQVCDLKAGDFFHVMGDAHVYSNHVDALHEQLQNDPRPFPILKINPSVKDIDGFKMSDFEIVDYNPHKKIPMKMAV